MLLERRIVANHLEMTRNLGLRLVAVLSFNNKSTLEYNDPLKYIYLIKTLILLTYLLSLKHGLDHKKPWSNNIDTQHDYDPSLK